MEQIQEDVITFAEYDRYVSDNCYRIILNSRLGCVEHIAAGVKRHSDFSVTLPTIPKSNIRDACVRIRSIFIPKTANLTRNYCYVTTDFLKQNTFNSKSNISVGAVGPPVVPFTTTNTGYLSNDILEIVSLSPKTYPKYTNGGDGPTSFNKILNTGEIREGGNGALHPGTQDVVGGFHNINLFGYEGKPLNDDWIPCHNPFGRNIRP
eukprot:SAG11_NODE_966_length_6356_cov_29.635608_5_plen_207_part_00